MGGIPEKNDAYFIPEFFRHYLMHKGKKSPTDIKTAKGDVPAERIRKIEIKFLGVWDTVMALGSRFQAKSGTSSDDKSFHTKPTPADCVKHARQALAIDEKRYDFRPEIWQECSVDQTLEQRWFAGAHGNVGGSYGNDGLANIALHWIVDEAKKLGLAVDTKFLKIYRGFAQDSLGDPYALSFKVVEAIRFKLGKGGRTLFGHPAAAKLSVDPTVIKRLCSDPGRFDDMTEAYRPKDIVEVARKHKSDKDNFIKSYGLDPAKYPFPDDI
jgi:hypothetical protein